MLTRHLISTLICLTGCVAGYAAEVRITAISVEPVGNAVLRHHRAAAARAIERRFGRRIAIVDPPRGGATRGIRLALAPAQKGSTIEVGRDTVTVSGPTELAAVYALGRVLRALEISNGEPVYRGESATLLPAVSMRGLYAPAHFANSYEKLPTSEMGELYDEWAQWGATATWSWVDPERRSAPTGDSPEARESLGYADRVIASLGAANQAGLETGLALTANVVWMDQFRDHPELRALQGPPLMYGMLLCPNQPEGRRIILGNSRWLLERVSKAGVKLGSIVLYDRDPSGCRHEQCQPWHRTSMKLMRETVELARQYNPGLKGDIVTWYWSPEEERQAVEWLPALGTDWLRFWFHHFPTWDVDPHFPSLPLPAGMKLGAMFNLSAAHNDVYGTEGAITRLDYFEKLFRPFAGHGLDGLHGYTEGNYDDINKAVALSLLAEPRRPVRDILREYARWYFGTTGALTDEVAGLILELDDLSGSAPRLPRIAARLNEIERALPAWGRDWRFLQLKLKAEIAILDIELLDRVTPRGAEAGAPQAPDYKSTVATEFRRIARGALERHDVASVQNVIADANLYLIRKNLVVRKRATLLHALMDRVYKVDADQLIGLTNLYLGDWPDWWATQSHRCNRILDAPTVERQHELIREFWP